ncbi:MAG: hypothetical protein ACTSYA_12145 [Candidatus Kariarchaeaceae archaeon]
MDSSQENYEFRTNNEKTYAIQRVFIYNDNHERVEYSEAAPGDSPSESSKTYTKDFEFNKITFATATAQERSGQRVVVDYVPTSIHQLVKTKAAMFLIEQSAVTNADEDQPAPTGRLRRRAERIEKAITEERVVGSEDEKFYDPTFGEVIVQRRFRTFN